MSVTLTKDKTYLIFFLLKFNVKKKERYFFQVPLTKNKRNVPKVEIKKKLFDFNL